MNYKPLTILALFALLAIFFVRAHPPLASTDSYFHLAIGRFVAKNHQIPKVDTFTFVSPGKEFISNEWLSGLILYLAYVNFGDIGILTLRTLVGLVTVFFLYRALSVIGIDFYLKVLAVLAAAVAISLRFTDRPEMFSFLFFSGLFDHYFWLNTRNNDNGH